MAMLESKGHLKDKKTRTEAEMIKRHTTERLLVRRGEALCRCEDPLRSNELVDQSLKGFDYATMKQPSPKREFAEP